MKNRAILFALVFSISINSMQHPDDFADPDEQSSSPRQKYLVYHPGEPTPEAQALLEKLKSDPRTQLHVVGTMHPHVPPQQPHQLGEECKDTRETQLFDDCSNEECLRFCTTVRNIDPIIPFSFAGEYLSRQLCDTPYGCGAITSASFYLATLMCCGQEDDKTFVDDYSFKVALLAREKLKQQGAKIFPCLAAKVKKKTE